MRGRIGFVTYVEYPEITDGDRVAAEALESRGWSVVATPWDSPDVEWDSLAAIVIRSTWNYHHRLDEFHEWLAERERQGVAIYNPPDVIRWNSNKRYLFELEERGVRIVPSVFVAPTDNTTLESIVEERGWRSAIAKPAVGASAWGATVITGMPTEEQEAEFRGLVRERGALVQPLMAEIHEGEWSLVFIAGSFSYTLLKVPAMENVFVQARHGGKASYAEAPGWMIEAASGVVDAAAAATGTRREELLYARVDGLATADEFTLMELELIEPALFFNLAEGAGERFAAGLITAIEGRRAQAQLRP